MAVKKIYKENGVYDEYTEFDAVSGRLQKIPENTFCDILNVHDVKDADGLHGSVVNGRQVFVSPVYETHTRFPRRVYMQITRKCNLLCDYCFIKANNECSHVPKEDIFEIAELMGNNGLMEVRLTGGEPTLHPDFEEIVDKFKKENIYVSIATNGVWTNRIREYLGSQDYIWIICSIDGSRDTHNAYRGETYDKVMYNLRNLVETNNSARLRLTTVLTKKNMKEMGVLGRIAKDVRAESITVIPLRPQVRKKEVVEEMVSSDQFKEVIEDLVESKNRYGIPFTTTMETDYKKEIYDDPIVRKRLSCAAGREATNLDYDYRKKKFLVYGCSYSPASDLGADGRIRSPFVAGEFRSEEKNQFLKIWEDDSAWEIYRDLSLRSNCCKKCTYLKNYECTGSCPIQNIDYDRIDVKKNVMEQLREQLVRTGEWYCYKKIFA